MCLIVCFYCHSEVERKYCVEHSNRRHQILTHCSTFQKTQDLTRTKWSGRSLELMFTDAMQTKQSCAAAAIADAAFVRTHSRWCSALRQLSSAQPFADMVPSGTNNVLSLRPRQARKTRTKRPFASAAIAHAAHPRSCSIFLLQGGLSR